jgi:hypothetical protein
LRHASDSKTRRGCRRLKHVGLLQRYFLKLDSVSERLHATTAVNTSTM